MFCERQLSVSEKYLNSEKERPALNGYIPIQRIMIKPNRTYFWIFHNGPINSHTNIKSTRLSQRYQQLWSNWGKLWKSIMSILDVIFLGKCILKAKTFFKQLRFHTFIGWAKLEPWSIALKHFARNTRIIISVTTQHALQAAKVNAQFARAFP